MNMLGNYKIEKILGQNLNQARTTYLASDEKGLVVLKQFEFGRGGTYRDQINLEKELKILQRLNHPQIPKYVGYFQTDDAYVLVLEYIAAENLNCRYFTQKCIWQIAEQILLILDYVHGMKIIHKDLKPANILFANGTTYLVDFGFSSDLSLSSPGLSSTFLGTAGFMPPEVFHQGKVCTQGDLYSLGITLFCLLARVETAEVGSYVNEDNYSLDLQELEIDWRLKQWLSRLCHISLKQRFGSAKEALNSLNQELQKREIELKPAFGSATIAPEIEEKEPLRPLIIESDFPYPKKSSSFPDKLGSSFFGLPIFSIIVSISAIVFLTLFLSHSQNFFLFSSLKEYISKLYSESNISLEISSILLLTVKFIRIGMHFIIISQIVFFLFQCFQGNDIRFALLPLASSIILIMIIELLTTLII